MNFTEYFEAYEEASNIFDFNMEKLNIYIESVEREYDINRQSAELKVIEESGTVDDLMYLYEAADKNKNEKSKSWFKRLIDNFVSFVQTIIEKLKDLFTSKDNQENLKKMKNTLDKNPKLKNTKIQYTDYSKDVKELKRDIDKSNKNIATGKSSMSTGKKILVGTTVTVTLAGALALLGKLTKDTITECKNQKESLKRDVESHLTPGLSRSGFEEAREKMINDEVKKNIDTRKMIITAMNTSLKNLKNSIGSAFKSIPSTLGSIPGNIKSIPNKFKKKNKSTELALVNTGNLRVANESYFDDDDFELESYYDYDDDFDF